MCHFISTSTGKSSPGVGWSKNGEPSWFFACWGQNAHINQSRGNTAGDVNGRRLGRQEYQGVWPLLTSINLLYLVSIGVFWISFPAYFWFHLFLWELILKPWHYSTCNCALPCNTSLKIVSTNPLTPSEKCYTLPGIDKNPLLAKKKVHLFFMNYFNELCKFCDVDN